jgi:SAM-dependent methyltransferase
VTTRETDALLGPVRRLYVESLHEHGTTSKAVGWKDEAEQQLRFDKLAGIVDGQAGSLTVNDLGCGYGAMFEYLARRFDQRLTGYLGIDISEEMIAAARARVTDARATFAQETVLADDADYTFVSGTFNVKMNASHDRWTELIETTLEQAAARSRKGLAFNLLSTYVDWRVDHLYYGDPRHFFDFCRRRLSRYVTLLHDYPLYEWTILVHK